MIVYRYNNAFELYANAGRVGYAYTMNYADGLGAFPNMFRIGDDGAVYDSWWDLYDNQS